MENTNLKLRREKKLYLLPAPISMTQKLSDFISENLIESIEVFFVENLRTARRLIKASFPLFDIDAKQWVQISKTKENIPKFFYDLSKQYDSFGVMSESGSCAIADPGSGVVKLAHQYNFIVKPLHTPSSILSALQSSGLNGQHFTFWGYFPIKEDERKEMIRKIYMQRASLNNYPANIFIETPYRTEKLMSYLIDNLKSETSLCIAQDIFGKKERVVTQKISAWKKSSKLTNIPSVFIISI